jgi:hypothetical protein
MATVAVFTMLYFLRKLRMGNKCSTVTGSTRIGYCFECKYQTRMKQQIKTHSSILLKSVNYTK